MGDLRADYLGVHLSIFEKIGAGERDGWSDRDEVDGMIAEIDWALSTTGGILEAHHRLLELGCGDGCLTVRLAGKHPCAVHGIDIVLLAIELAAKRAAAEGVIIHLQAGNVTGLPWPESCFDVVVDDTASTAQCSMIVSAAWPRHTACSGPVGYWS